MRNDAKASPGFAKLLSLLKMPAETEPFASRTPFTVTVRSAARAALSTEAYSDIATASFQIILLLLIIRRAGPMAKRLRRHGRICTNRAGSAGFSHGRPHIELAQPGHPDGLRCEPPAHCDSVRQGRVELNSNRLDRDRRARQRCVSELQGDKSENLPAVLWHIR